jgi:hypothetical protein
MTAQLAILNKRGVVVASDSAGSTKINGNTKIFNSSNKIVVPSSKHPIAFMSYGSAELSKVPMDLLIELYGKRLGETTFATLEDYALDFIKFLESGEAVRQEDNNWNFLESWLDDYLYYCQKKYTELAEKDEDFNKFLATEAAQIAKQPAVVELSEAERSTLRSRVQTKLTDIDKTFSENFRTLIGKVREPLEAQILACLEKDPFFNPTAIVICGFGDKEIYPKCVHFKCEGFLFSKLRKTPLEHWGITGKYMAEPGPDARAWILRFAQNDGARTFMHGIDQELENYLTKEVRKAKDTVVKELAAKESFATLPQDQAYKLSSDVTAILESATTTFIDAFQKFKNDKYLNPILDTAVYLELEEMVDLARILVSLTIIRRKYSMGQNESAGGPVDVCVVTRNHGAVWVDRKSFELKKG